MKKLFFSLPLATLTYIASTTATYAHCPLCTLGAGAAAVGAGWLGVEKIAIGVLLGGFSVAMGLWMSGLIKKQFVPYQKWIVATIVALSTALPLIPMLTYYSSIYIRLSGSYGSLLNRTYAINLFVVGLIIGAIIMLLMPLTSQQVTRLRGGKTWPYQGVSLSIALMIVVATLLQILT